MKKSVILSLAAISVVANTSFADPILSDNFDNYTGGNLVGQGTWAQTGSVATAPVQVSGGVATIGNTGQDIYDPLNSPVTLADGQSLYFGITLNVSAAQTAGDYFMHFTPSVGNSSIFDERVFIKATTGGYLIGLQGTSGGSNPVYGTTVLNLNTSYNFILAYNYSATTPTNSTGAIYINPTDSSVGNNTAYLNAAWGSTTIDTNTVAAVNFRQGSASSAPTLTIDNLVVSQIFADAAPEPPTIAFAAIGGVACFLAVRRKR